MSHEEQEDSDRGAAGGGDALPGRPRVDWRERVSINPRVCSGQPCIKGTRVLVSVILDNLAEGESVEAIMEGYRVTREDIRASLAFAADLAADRHIPLEQGTAESSGITRIGRLWSWTVRAKMIRSW